MGLTTDPNDPRLGHGAESQPGPQNEVYLVLSEADRRKGYIRPVRRTYVHAGVRPKYPTRPLTTEEGVRGAPFGYVAYEEYPAGSPEAEAGLLGRMWTNERLKSGCGAETTMAQAIAETYAANPRFYGATYCTHCHRHLPVEEFVWDPAPGEPHHIPEAYRRVGS